MVEEFSARFRERVAIITGAMGGIGSATARRFAQEGARVVLADIPDAVAAEGAALVQSCKSLGAPDAVAVACDVSREADVAAAAKLALSRFGRIDVVANIAGLMIFKPLKDFSADEWKRLLDVNLMGAVFFTREALHVMTPGSAIVNVSSIHAIQTSPLVAPYAAAKAALLSLTRSTAIEGKANGIRANAVMPGAIDTPMLRSNPNVASGDERMPAGPPGRPEDVAAVVAFLASHEAAFITGSVFTADGGRLATL